MTTQRWSDPRFDFLFLVALSAILAVASVLSGCITTEQRDCITEMMPVATATPQATPAPTATATPVPTTIISTGDKKADLCARFGARYEAEHVIFDGLSVDTRNRLFVAWCSEGLGNLPVMLNGNEIFMRCK
jgi:hypothetical protein